MAKVYTCPGCGYQTDEPIYDATYDVFYCPKCKTWLERNCGGKDCEFCSCRPEKAPEETVG